MNGRVKIALGLGTALVAAGALTSCSKGGGAAAAFNEAPSSTAYVLTPGEYETTVRLTNGTVTGFPPEVQQNLDRAKQNPQTQRGCVPVGFSLDSASLKNLRITLPNDMGGCNIGETTLEGGSYRAALSCDIRNLPQGRGDSPRALTIAANMNGTYSGDTSSGTGHAEVTEPGGSRSGTVDIEISTRRVGDCQAPRPYTPSTYPPAPPTYSPTPPSYGGNSTTTTTNTTTTYDSNMSGTYGNKM